MLKFDISDHSFTRNIRQILQNSFENDASSIFASSPLLGYLNHKTRSANRGSKARGSFANHYALYVLVEHYIVGGFAVQVPASTYEKSEGARFSDLMSRQRELPFGAKLQNHALNSRLNDEFRKYYPSVNKVPIVRDVTTQRYWIQEDLLLVTVRDAGGIDIRYNIAEVVIEIIDKYVEVKTEAFDNFLETCKRIAKLGDDDSEQAGDFISQQLAPNVDARVFEIVSYAVLKARYSGEHVWIGKRRCSVHKQVLVLYKTGRTNANDGGIDFVMRPLGRFFQVTESLDLSKYFLDIDKVQRFPITFVIKSSDSIDKIRSGIRDEAIKRYKVRSVVEMYMNAVEEIINITMLEAFFKGLVDAGDVGLVMDEIVAQSMVEFNF